MDGLHDVAKSHVKTKDAKEIALMMEFILHGLAEFSEISKKKLEAVVKFSDLVGSIFNMQAGEEEI